MRRPTPARRLISVWVALLCLSSVAWAQPKVLEQEKTQALEARRALRQQLEALQVRVITSQAQEKEAATALQTSELAISATVRRLGQLDTLLAKFEADLAQTQKTMTQVNQRIGAQTDALAQQLRAQYSSGLNAWSALLAGDDPQAISRDLGYLEFVSRSRGKIIEGLRDDQAELLRLEQTQKTQKASIEKTRKRLVLERDNLAREQAQQARVHETIRKQLASERGQAQRLAQDEKRLSALIEDLTQQMQRWREQESQNAQAVRQAALASLPQGSVIKRGLPRPVDGAVVARFGSKRPEGGSWRGVLMRASEGDAVKTVAGGTVVFAKWLAGFGNIIIVDHDDGFLTIYAHNQSLLKDAGDVVRTGEVVARAGNTGGQLDSALYFEIRHRGQPLDPMLYFKKQ